jgi:hypothetical protein
MNPLLWTIATTTDKERAELSRFTWLDDGSGIYRLRVLGVLNGLFGVTLERRD